MLKIIWGEVFSTHLRPGAIVLKLDFRNAYNSAIRSAILRAITKHCPHLSPIARCILADETIHWWFGEETVAAAIHAQRGVDQGCEGLPLDVALSFHTTFANGAITHLLRANLVSEAWCEAWDSAALKFWELELQRDLTTD